MAKKNNLPKEVLALRKRVNKLYPTLRPLTDHQETYFMLETAAKTKSDVPNHTVWTDGYSSSHVEPVRFYYTYATVIDRCEEFNVVRYFSFSHTNYKRKPNIHQCLGEVQQVWIAPDGKAVVRERALAMYHYYRRQPFSFWNDMRIKPYASNYDLWEKHLLIRSVTPELRKRGIVTTTRGINPEELITGLLTSNKIETLWKTKQYKAIDFYNTNNMTPERTEVFFTALKIANRHHYSISDFGIWFDMVTTLKAIGKDIHSPHYVCPSNLQEMHDKAVSKLERMQEDERIKKLVSEATLHEASYSKRVAKYRNICIENDNVRIFVCPTVKDMAEEGERMHHCVYRCGYYKAEHDCLILFVRDKQGNRISTVELGTKKWNIRQNRGLQNCVPQFKDEVNALIEQNITLFKQVGKHKTTKPQITESLSLAA